MRKVFSSRGITLVELMTIVVIIGIVSAMAFPRFSATISRLRFKSAARDMLSTMRLARSNAITHKQPFGVCFDGDTRTMTMFVDVINPATNMFETGDSVLTIDTLPETFVALGTDFTSSSVIYRPNGSASSTGNVNFLAYTPDDFIHYGSIEVLASTGRTKLGSLFFY